jgi:2-keto-4-pentenoate hydratase/2-oxohepta-3-ene-1,7-dioic acid hydratase in catechol pathway
MQFASFTRHGRATFGIVTTAGVVDAGPRIDSRYADLRAAIAADALQEVADLCGDHDADIGSDEVRFLPVIPQPAKIFCVGINYVAHREETGRAATSKPTIFTRFPDTLVGHGQPIVQPAVSGMLDYECELAVIIGKGGRHIHKSDAMDHVAGFSCFNDGSVRDWQNHSSQFTPGKNFPSTGGFGPYLVTPDDVGDVHDLDLQTRLNGEVMQSSNTGMLIFDIPALIEYLSAFTVLSPGDVIATGTPGGVGFKRDPVVFLQPGDEVTVEIEKVGLLCNPIVAERAAP